MRFFSEAQLAAVEAVQHPHAPSTTLQVFLKGGFSTYPYPLSASPVHLRFTDVVDLLVGWSLDEAVPSAVRCVWSRGCSGLS